MASSRFITHWFISLFGSALLVAAPAVQAARVAPERVALRQLNDGMGWKKEAYYKTIHTEDLDGDGQSELLARWIDGLRIFRFESGALVTQSFLPAFSDRAGFSRPSWYETIHAAHLDPASAMADIVAREADGIHVFRFDSAKKVWNEIGQGQSRPFADSAGDGTNWDLPQYYETIRLADLNRDGVAELIGRGKKGLAVYSWDNSSETWHLLTGEGELADGEGYEQPSSYETVQTADVDGDGVPEMLVRSSGGIITLRWTGNGFTPITTSGPFADADGSNLSGRYRSIHTYVDSARHAWLAGMVADDSGKRGTIQVFRWKDGNWRTVSTIPLPGDQWDRESRASVLLMADLVGSPAPELMVRSAAGLVGYTLQGKRLKDRLPIFSDAQGWNREQQFSTLTMATIHGSGPAIPVVLGRGRTGLQAWKYEDTWRQAADTAFPDFCANGPGTPSCIAYSCLSIIGAGVFDDKPVTDIRSQYPVNSLKRDFWQGASRSLYLASVPTGRGSCTTVPLSTWVTVQNQLTLETSMVAVVAGWFSNNNEVFTVAYGAAGDLLNEVVGNLNDINGSTQVDTKWASLGLDIASGLLSLIPDVGSGIDLAITIIKDVVDDSATHDPSSAINGLFNDIDKQQNAWLLNSANQRQTYVTDYGQLLQIGSAQTDWANKDSPDVSLAKTGSKNGFRTHYYKVISPYLWQVSWCSGIVFDKASVPCPPVDTPDKYYCRYGTPIPGQSPYHSNAYLSTGEFGPPLSWSTVDKLTGNDPNNSDDLNVIWYMIMLGSGLGWDYQAYYVQNPITETELSYDKLMHGYSGPTAGCQGNGSTTGIQSSGQTAAQSLIVAQANTLTFGPGYVRHLDHKFDKLAMEVRATNLDGGMRAELLEYLQQAKALLDRVYRGPSGTISATTPTLLLDWFIRRAESSSCSQEERAMLTTSAYELLSALEKPTGLTDDNAPAEVETTGGS